MASGLNSNLHARAHLPPAFIVAPNAKVGAFSRLRASKVACDKRTRAFSHARSSDARPAREIIYAAGFLSYMDLVCVYRSIHNYINEITSIPGTSNSALILYR